MNIDISKLYQKLEGEYTDGGYVIRATIFNRALSEGKITEEVWNRAREQESIMDGYGIMFAIDT